MYISRTLQLFHTLVRVCRPVYKVPQTGSAGTDNRASKTHQIISTIPANLYITADRRANQVKMSHLQRPLSLVPLPVLITYKKT
jgi:hypothetical protein